MNGSLLDTNVIVKALRGDMDAIRFLDGLTDVYISAVAVGELRYGAKKSARTDENVEMIRELTDGIEILPVDEETAVIYAEIKNELVSTGFNLPENDLWIAAVAQRNDLALATFDAHFKSIKSIKTIGC